MSKEKVSKRFIKAVGNQYAGPLGPIIQQLLDFLMQFISGACPAKDVKDVAKNHPAFVLRKLIQESLDNGHSRKDAKIFAQAGLDTINASSAADLDGLDD